MMFLLFALCIIPAIMGQTDQEIEAFRQHVQREAENLWKTMDYNMNGEFDRHDLQTLIHDYDSDNDGEVTILEFEFHFDMAEPTLAIVAKALFSEYDDNGDGLIDSLDLDGVHDRMDHILPKDGRIDHAEFVAYQTELLTLLYVLQIQAGQP